MPDRPQSTPDPTAVPPVINPAEFEDFAVFRETFLCVFTQPEDNLCLRMVGNLVYNMALEYRGYWPNELEGVIRTGLRALVADLRVIQGHLASMADPENACPNTAQEEHHLAVAGRIAVDIQHAADTLELELGPWRGEEE